ncbi:hypothetical protein HQ308_16840 [Rhodococcus sp. BP-241]|uniref:hypothetical protein n=1 Tax=Rhodococcus sp. BP-241 TaxID=2739441 RepID=UPI001C9AC589|nr:hypothetical protein [Rhodococcus sp. BP-241]MBY6708469.1 hypothetical protein [Rhodococcus sp. BP-241]
MAKYFQWVGGTVRLQPDADVDKLRRDLDNSDTPDVDNHYPVQIAGVDKEDPLGNVWLTVHPWALDWYLVLDGPDAGEGAPEPS